MSDATLNSEAEKYRSGVAKSWCVLGESVQGAAHKRRNLPNQDAHGFCAAPDGQLPIILAISDGHGSDRCFRSHHGSKLAVRTAISESRACLEALSTARLSEIRDTFERRFVGHLVRTWKANVLQHAALHPFTKEELPQPAGAEPPTSSAEFSESQITHAYGATLLVLILTQQFAVYLQLGDGEMLVVTDGAGSACPDGQSIEVTRPLPKDPSLIANETSSLCRDDAERSFRTRFHVLSDTIPALILLCTDGYSNAFESSAGFEQTASDLLREIRECGVASIRESLTSELDHVSKAGSGDDVTMAFAVRMSEGADAANWAF